jgi:preprotein translocase subunit Sss1
MRVDQALALALGMIALGLIGQLISWLWGPRR